MYLPIACPAGTHIPKTEQQQKKATYTYIEAIYYETGMI